MRKAGLGDVKKEAWILDFFGRICYNRNNRHEATRTKCGQKEAKSSVRMQPKKGTVIIMNYQETVKQIRNIAVIVAGIDEEYQNSIIEGIIDCAKTHHANISCFASFSGVIASKRYDVGEYNIYELVNLEKFDAVILMTNTISNPEEKEKIIRKVKESGLPAVVLDGEDDPDFYHVRIHNHKAMREIIQHVIQKHHACQICCIAGPQANPEARERYQAFVDVMKENHLEIGKNQVYFGDFRAVDGKKAIETFMSANMAVPDAIICANDAMALAVVAELEKHDYNVPDDIIVTGFDNTYNARHYCPSLTTVSRPLNEAGYKACEMLLHLLNGETVEHKKILDAEPVFAESCGCSNEVSGNIRQYKKSTFQLIDDCRNDISLLNRMTTELAESETIEENFEVVSHFIQEIECEKYCICLCSEWEGVYRDVLGQKEEAYQVHGYTKNMSAPLVWDKGEIRSVAHFRSADMFPETLETGGNISYFLPLHFRERCLGYYVITNGEFPIRSMLCHSLMLNISNSIENIRKLIHLGNVIHELDVLYTTDPMCGIYNRNGFIRMADKILTKAREEQTGVLIAFIDMDGLKMINDNYGHKEGDFALQRLATAIYGCCENGNICARFGGDEFIILGGNASDADIEPLEGMIHKRIADANHVIGKPYQIDASIGMIVTKVTKEDTLFGLITQADALMYEEKRRKKTSRYLRKE